MVWKEFNVSQRGRIVFGGGGVNFRGGGLWKKRIKKVKIIVQIMVNFLKEYD